MIFVTVGTNEARFDRLLHAVAALTTEEEIVIQHGHSSPVEHPNALNIDFLPYEALVQTIRRARMVVTHAGVGSVMVALANARRPIVVPRRASFGEAVDDHQLQLGRRLATAGLVTFVEAPTDLKEALNDANGLTEPPGARSSALAADLRAFFVDVLTPRNAPMAGRT
jgi:UDP-N-acetylglucosamine transferase subunit ALG13